MATGQGLPVKADQSNVASAFGPGHRKLERDVTIRMVTVGFSCQDQPGFGNPVHFKRDVDARIPVGFIGSCPLDTDRYGLPGLCNGSKRHFAMSVARLRQSQARQKKAQRFEGARQLPMDQLKALRPPGPPTLNLGKM